MAQQIINDGETGLVVRGKINDNFTELYEGGSVITGLTANRLVISASETSISDDADLTWDGTNNALTVDGQRIHGAGNKNTFIGGGAGNFSIGVGLENVGIGDNTLAAITTANRNTAVGYNALPVLVSGFNNVAVGNAALLVNTGSSNTAIGKSAMEANTSGASNVAVGANALKANVVGASSTAIGTNALTANTANGNTAVGSQAAAAVTTGTKIVAIGANALGGTGLTAPTDSVAVGYNALFACAGVRNIGVGTETLSANTAGTDNIAIGNSAGDFFASGSQNVMIGSSAMVGDAGTNSGGSDNVCVGYRSNYYNTGDKNITIGSNSNPSGAGAISGSNKILIGSSLTDQSVSTSNTLNIQNALFGVGNSGTGTTLSAGGIGVYVVTPTAAMDIIGATTSRASLRLRSGTAPTSPNDGDIWYDGTDLKIRVGGTTKTVTLT